MVEEVRDEVAAFSIAVYGCKVATTWAGRDVAKERSQMERRARPWAIEARRPTVQIMAASR
ncbi:hypothetical protein ColLi_04874 [Colletotrichum liriopes]|uniref:Uncharacterized protein n=1 Tax=Colletotrichum liriopes TaxID=708192 RepID=A0AA37GJ99_9PEZI|nr:hypothetical protein ColLi_04874 [Colletotrichum liriopes]